MLSEIAQRPGGPPDYPTPWTGTADASFLATPEATRDGLLAGGFSVASLRDATEQALAFGAHSRTRVARGEKPPPTPQPD